MWLIFFAIYWSLSHHSSSNRYLRHFKFYCELESTVWNFCMRKSDSVKITRLQFSMSEVSSVCIMSKWNYKQGIFTSFFLPGLKLCTCMNSFLYINEFFKSKLTYSFYVWYFSLFFYEWIFPFYIVPLRVNLFFLFYYKQQVISFFVLNKIIVWFYDENRFLIKFFF